MEAARVSTSLGRGSNGEVLKGLELPQCHPARDLCLILASLFPLNVFILWTILLIWDLEPLGETQMSFDLFVQ